MSQNESNLQRVFIHEMGHFIAKEIVFKHYKTHKPVSLSIKYQGNDFTGGVDTEKPEGWNEDWKVLLAPLLAELSYGCLFESLYLKNSFDTCFNRTGHGNCDLQDWAGQLGDASAELKTGILNQTEAHRNEIIKNEILNQIFELPAANYILKDNGTEIVINVNQLRSDIEPFLPTIEEYFLKYLKVIDALLVEEF